MCLHTTRRRTGDAVLVAGLAALLGAVGLMVTGCEPASITPTPTATATALPAPTATLPEPSATVAEMATDEPTAAPTDMAEPTEDATSGADVPGVDTSGLALRPDAPAAVNEDFRSDPADVVAKTGHPQLLEFFTWW